MILILFTKYLTYDYFAKLDEQIKKVKIKKLEFTIMGKY